MISAEELRIGRESTTDMSEFLSRTDIIGRRSARTNCESGASVQLDLVRLADNSTHERAVTTARAIKAQWRLVAVQQTSQQLVAGHVVEIRMLFWPVELISRSVAGV